MMVLTDEFLEAYGSTENLFQRLMQQDGEVFRAVKNRKTLRFEAGEKAYFIKQHRGIGLAETLKNWLALKSPVFGAKQEWQALQALKALNIPTTTLVGYGQRGYLPWRQHSFVITEALDNTVSLNDIIPLHNTGTLPLPLKRHLLKTLAEQLATMHAAGINHRDCYLGHFRFHKMYLDSKAQCKDLKLSVMDLHRAQCRKVVPLRWRRKDLIGIVFSSMALSLTLRDRLRFIQYYHGQPLRQLLKSVAPFWEAVLKYAKRLYGKNHR